MTYLASRELLMTNLGCRDVLMKYLVRREVLTMYLVCRKVLMTYLVCREVLTMYLVCREVLMTYLVCREVLTTSTPLTPYWALGLSRGVLLPDSGTRHLDTSCLSSFLSTLSLVVLSSPFNSSPPCRGL